MKKSIGIILCFAILFWMSACNGAPLQNEPTTESLSATSRQSSNERPEITEESQETTEQETSPLPVKESNQDVGGAVIRPLKYRARFYSVFEPFVQLVGEDRYLSWVQTIDQSQNAETMVMLHFVQDFHITREQFDKANLETAKIIKNSLDGRPCLRPMDYANQETDEIYNADIIYTFDEDIINAYYLGPDYPFTYDIQFDEAVAAGDYVSQTEEWIDVDKMEAEILAKYGSLD